VDLVLWRHAEAEPGEPDEGRKLTQKGEKQARRVAEWLHNRLPESAKILSSPAKRAQQTAHALAEVSHRKVRTVEALAPDATVDEILDGVGWTAGKGTLVVVGHQLALGRVASRLLSGVERDWTIKKGAIVWISHRGSNGDAEPILRAAVGPELA
jgi:phosphohistidine phosphatase